MANGPAISRGGGRMRRTTRQAVVTGSASGIGQAVALKLLEEGHSVIAADLNEAGLECVIDAGASAFVGDLASSDVRDRLVALATGSEYLVNAAGIVRPRPILESTVEDIREVFAINLEAVWDLVSRIGRTMPLGSAIVNVASSSAKLATTTENAVYAASKAAVLSITRSFAYAFAPQNVRVNAICPAIVDTPMQDQFLSVVAATRGASVSELSAERLRTVPLRRSATAAECAAVICFLLSDGAGYMTGQAVNFTGGQVMW